MVAFCAKMEANSQGEFEKNEFVGGCQRLGADTIAQLKAAIPSLREAMVDKEGFREIYLFAFNWSKENGQKGMEIAMASRLKSGYRLESMLVEEQGRDGEICL